MLSKKLKAILMPHFAIQYSANLRDAVDIGGLCEALRQAALASGLFEIGAVRVRAVRCDDYAIADIAPENAFLDLEVRIGTGRSLDEKRLLGERLTAVLETALAGPLTGRHFALSVEIREIDPDLSWRRNAIHERLRTVAS